MLTLLANGGIAGAQELPTVEPVPPSVEIQPFPTNIPLPGEVAPTSVPLPIATVAPTQVVVVVPPTLAVANTPTTAPADEPTEDAIPTLAPEESATPSGALSVEAAVQTAMAGSRQQAPSPTFITTPTYIPFITVSPTRISNWFPPGAECNQTPGKTLFKLDVPYIHQVIDVGGANGNWACGPVSVAMVLAYYGKLDTWGDYVTDQIVAGRATVEPKPGANTMQIRKAPPLSQDALNFAPYVTNVYTSGGHLYNALARDPNGKLVAGLYGTISPTGYADWSRMRSVFQLSGLKVQQSTASWNGIVDALKRGHPVIIGTDLTSEGHILVATGYTSNNQLIVNDPYGNRFAPGYGGTDGSELIYPWACMRARVALEVIGDYPVVPRPTRTSIPAPASANTVAAAPISPANAALLRQDMRDKRRATPAPSPTAVPVAHKSLVLDTRVHGSLSGTLETFAASKVVPNALEQSPVPTSSMQGLDSKLLGLSMLVALWTSYGSVLASRRVRKKANSPIERKETTHQPSVE